MTDDRGDDLRATAESIVVDAENLKEIELEKLEREPEDSTTRELSEKAERLAQEIAEKARLEKHLAEELTKK